jgi:hypothetical protein
LGVRVRARSFTGFASASSTIILMPVPPISIARVRAALVALLSVVDGLVSVSGGMADYYH